MPYFWLRASNDFGAIHYWIQTIKMGFNNFLMFVTFQYRGLHHLGMYCTLIIEAWLKSNIHFDCRYLEIWKACIFRLVFIVLDVSYGTESKYPSIVFLSIVLLIYIINLHSLTLFMLVDFACIFSHDIYNVFLKTSILQKYLSEYRSDWIQVLNNYKYWPASQEWQWHHALFTKLSGT